MRILSIDYGKKRTGLAVTDPSQIIANGLATVETQDLIKYLKQYVDKEPVERFVVGLPTQTNGLPSENQKRVLAFSEKLRKNFPNIPISFYDERFTSVLAHQTILESGIGKNADKMIKDLWTKSVLALFYKATWKANTNFSIATTPNIKATYIH